MRIGNGRHRGLGAVGMCLLMLHLVGFGAMEWQVPFVIRSWTMESGAPTDRINDLIEGEDGFLWLATYEGLVRFDGHTYKVFNHQNHPSLVGGITIVLETQPGTLWMLSTSGKLVRLDKGKFSAWSAADGLPSDPGEILRSTPEGQVMFAGPKGFLTVDGTDRIVPYPTPGLPEMVARDYAFDEAGTLWVAAREGALWRWDAGKVQKIEPSKLGAASDRVNAIYPQPDGSLWLGLQGGVGKYDPEQDKLKFIADPEFDRQNRKLRLSLKEGEFKLGGNSLGGLYFFLKDEVKPFELGDFGDRGETINAITHLREGGFALGTYSRGLVLLSPASFPFFNRQNGLEGILVNAIAPYRGDEKLIATHRGMDVFDGETFRPLEVEGKPFTEYTVDAFPDSKGRIWLATMGVGLLMQETPGGEWMQLSRANGLATDTVRCFAEDSAGNIWIGTRQGVYRWNNGLQQHYTAMDGLRSEYVLTLYVDSEDTVWVGTARGGLMKIVDGEVRSAQEDGDPEEFINRTIFSIYSDRNGTLWGGMTGGIFRIENGTVDFVNLYERMDIDAVYHVIDDGQKYFWLTSSRGLHRLPYETLAEDLLSGRRLDANVRRFGKQDGLPTDAMRPISRAYVDEKQRLWMPTENGFFIMDPADIPVSTTQPEVFFDAIDLNNQALRNGWHFRSGDAVLEPGVRRIQFVFSAPSFRTLETIRYRTRLQGFEDEWRESPSRYAEYTNLPRGQYNFEVQAANSDGVWSEHSATFSFVVQPMLRERAFFYPLLALIAILIGLSLHFWRNRLLRARQAELTRLVDERTRELSLLNEEKNAFLGIAAHDLRNPIANIESLAMLLESDMREFGTPEMVEYNQDIMDCTRKMSALLSNLLDINRIEQGETMADIQRIDPLELLQLTVNEFKRAASAKQIHVEMDACCPAIQADPILLRQVFENLLSNAIKYSPAGATVRISCKQNDGKLSICFSDEGPGIPESEHSRVFKKFPRLSPKPTAGELSTGLGLSIAKHLTLLMRGTIDFDTAVGKGTTFRVAFNLA